MDQIIQSQIDQDNFLDECEAAAEEANNIASFASEDWLFDERSHELQKVLFSGQPVKIGYIIDQHDGEFIAHARISNPDLAARVLQFVEMVRERDKRIAELSKAPATHRCVNCRLYMSDDQDTCPNCSASQDDE